MVQNTQALVIGNGAYSGALKLACSRNDASTIATSLFDLNINVALGLDLSYDETCQIVDKFIDLVNLPSTDTSIFYYSGHGMQILEQNYIVPIDFDQYADQNLAKLFSVQSILDRMSRASAVRIVILDACRSNAGARQFVGGKGIASEKAFFINDTPLPRSGLAEMRASSNTYIAFAAGPGDVALDGLANSKLSPFTEALLKHLDVVDLPISNLFGRVRQDVLTLTNGRQRTWDQSSLMTPFYFHPASFLFFTGTFAALLGLLFSVALCASIIGLPSVTGGWIAGAIALSVFSLAVLLFEALSVYSRLRGNIGWQEDGRQSLQRHFVTSLRRGLVGGYLGALVAAVPLSITYFHLWPSPAEAFVQLLLETTSATALAACALGFFCTFFAKIRIVHRKIFFVSEGAWIQIILGSLFGGGFTGIIIAPVVTYYFGSMLNRPPLTPEYLLPGAVLGASAIIFAIVNFDFERLSSRRVWTSACSSVAAVAAGAVAAGVMFTPLYFFGIVDAVENWLHANYFNTIDLLVGGAAYGIPVGMVLGLVVGITLVSTQRWSRKAVLV